MYSLELYALKIENFIAVEIFVLYKHPFLIFELLKENKASTT